MSHEHTDGTKLGPGFDAVGVSTADDQDYPNEWEMEDTASSSVRVVGEVVPETDVSSLGLSPQVALTADSLRNVTGPSTAAARNPGDAGSDLNENLFTDANVAETTASGIQTQSDVRQTRGSIATSRRVRSKSPHGRTTGRELSPRSQTAELRARIARVRQMKLTQYLEPPPQLPAPPVITTPRDTVTRAEADAAMGVLQQQIGDATQRTDVLLQAVAETHQKAQEAGRIAVSGAAGVAQTNAGLAKMVEELRHELQQMRTKIEGAEERASTAQRIADSAEQRATTLSMLLTQQNSVLWLPKVMLTRLSRSSSCWNRSYEMLTWHFKKKGRSVRRRLQLHSTLLECCKMNCMMLVHVWMPRESLYKMWQE